MGSGRIVPRLDVPVFLWLFLALLIHMRAEPARATWAELAHATGAIQFFLQLRMGFRRRQLPHDPPDWLNPTQEAFFITINCLPRHRNQLAIPEVWKYLIESIEFREDRGVWKWKLILAMPDHLHGIVIFPNSFFMKKCVASWKRWLAKEQGIHWQRDFFDHRLRSVESAVEKANYIRNNPVRAGLVESAEKWPFVR